MKRTKKQVLMSRYVKTKTRPRPLVLDEAPRLFGDVPSHKITDFQIPSRSKLAADYKEFVAFLKTAPAPNDTLSDLVSDEVKPKVLKHIRARYKYLKTINDFDLFTQPIQAALFGIN